MLIKKENGLRFHEIPDSCVILAKGGVYKQAMAYIRGNALYAKHGAGYVQLSTNGTSVPNLRVDAIAIEGIEVEPGATGRYEVTKLEGFEITDPKIPAQTTRRIEGPA